MEVIRFYVAGQSTQAVVDTAVKVAGGATVYTAIGYWGMLKEPAVVIEVFVDPIDRLALINRIRETIRDKTTEEAFGIVFGNGHADIVNVR